jgi:hypothetical protein
MNASIRCGAVVMVLSALALTGCYQPRSPGKDNKPAPAVAKAEENKHAGWWCEEHGIPEEICSLCSTKAAAKFKKEGDWCKEHDRALSQCFKCDPSKYARFEAMYVAKHGNKPPRPPEEEFQK